MDLLPPEVRACLARFPIGSQEGARDAARVVVKYFFPSGRYTLFVTEAERQGDDYLLFGYCLSPFGAECDEWGYASLAELRSLRIRGLGIERDTCVRPGERTLAELLGRVHARQEKVKPWTSS